MPTRLEVQIILKPDPKDPDWADEIADTLGELLKAVQAQGLTPQVSQAPVADGVPEPEPEPPPPTAAGPPKRVRDRTAERRAKAAAEAAVKADGHDKHALDEDDPLMGAADAAPGADPFDDDPLAEVDDTAPLPPGPDRKPVAAAKAPAPPAKTEKEYMEGSLILLRQCYGAPGGWEQVKIVQKEFKVSKFLDVPLDRAADLYKRARALAQTMGVQIPPGV